MDLFVVVDSFGFVAAFPSRADAEKKVDEYPSSRFLLMRCRLSEDHPTKTVFAIPYRDIDSVAYVTNDPARARKVHEALLSIGLTYPDEIKYWEYDVGQVPEPVQRRLDTFEIALKEAYSSEDAKRATDKMMETIDGLEKPARDMLARIERETACLDITEHMRWILPEESDPPPEESDPPPEESDPSPEESDPPPEESDPPPEESDPPPEEPTSGASTPEAPTPEEPTPEELAPEAPTPEAPTSEAPTPKEK